MERRTAAIEFSVSIAHRGVVKVGRRGFDHLQRIGHPFIDH